MSRSVRIGGKTGGNDLHDDSNIIDSLFGNIFLLVMLGGFFLGVAFYLFSYSINDEQFGESLRGITMILFGAIIASVIHEKVLGNYYENQSRKIVQNATYPNFKAIEMKMIDEISQIAPNVKEETVGSIKDIQERVTEATKYMLDGIGVLSGAKAAGIAAIFPTRYEEVAGETFNGVVRQDFNEEGNHIRIMGISLGDFFLDRGALHKDFIKLIDANCLSSACKIRALIVHPKCDALRERAKWETGKECYYEPTFYASTTFIETEGAAKIAQRLCEKYGCLDVRLYKQPPTAFVILTTRYAFVEPYHYGDRGSNAPLFQIQAGSSLYKNYESHFERIWAEADPVTTYQWS